LWGPALVSGHRVPSAVFAVSLGCGLAFLLGASELVRARQQRALAVSERREQEALRRAGEERLRIARELHDVVAHNIAVINVQANTALHLMGREPERARSALETINEVSKQALVELRSVLGVLRGVDEPEPRAPAPTLGRLDELLASARASGLAVRLEEEGARPQLPANVDLAAFRIVQEALTNSARHASGTGALVRIVYGDREVELDVDDDGAARGRPTPPVVGSGRGIVGMRERAQSLGGSLRAGPRPEGGFSVSARLPYRAETA
jgi:signal transduction histidine kinase